MQRQRLALVKARSPRASFPSILVQVRRFHSLFSVCVERKARLTAPIYGAVSPDLLSILPSSNPRCSAPREAPSQCFGALTGCARRGGVTPFPVRWQRRILRRASLAFVPACRSHQVASRQGVRAPCLCRPHRQLPCPMGACRVRGR